MLRPLLVDSKQCDHPETIATDTGLRSVSSSCTGEGKKPGRNLTLLFGTGAKNDVRMQDKDVDRFEGHEKRKLCGWAAGEA
jgi:hypothetical protein